MFGLMPRRREGARPVLRREDPLDLFRRELDNLFESVFGDESGLFEEPRPWGLLMDNLEKEVVIRAEAPGFEVGDFDLHIAGDVLTIAAEHKGAQGKPEKESRSVRMSRSVLLPPGLDVDKVEAVYRNGVLEIHLPRKPEAMSRRIEVKP